MRKLSASRALGATLSFCATEAATTHDLQSAMAAPAPASSDLVEPVTPTAWAGPAAAPAPASAIPSSPETRAADTEVEAFELPPEIEPSPEALPTGAAAPAASEPGREVASRSDAFAISAQPPSQPPPPPRQRRLRRPTKDHLSDHSTKDVPVAEASRTEWEQSRLEFLADGGACLPDGTPIALEYIVAASVPRVPST